MPNLVLFLAARYPGVLVFYIRVKAVLGIPYRLFKRKEYISVYEAAMKQFEVGDIVRVKRREGEAPVIKLSPSVQQAFDLPASSRDVKNFVEWKQREPIKGTVIYSFFEEREPWVIESFQGPDLSGWLYQKIVQGFSNRTPGGVILRPLTEQMIVWQAKSPLGTNRMWWTRDFLELVPKEDIEAFYRQFEVDLPSK